MQLTRTRFADHTFARIEEFYQCIPEPCCFEFNTSKRFYDGVVAKMAAYRLFKQCSGLGNLERVQGENFRVPQTHGLEGLFPDESLRRTCFWKIVARFNMFQFRFLATIFPMSCEKFSIDVNALQYRGVVVIVSIPCED